MGAYKAGTHLRHQFRLRFRDHGRILPLGVEAAPARATSGFVTSTGDTLSRVLAWNLLPARCVPTELRITVGTQIATASK